VFPQLPQLDVLDRLTQAPAHRFKPVLHVDVHAPSEQVALAFGMVVVQGLPHAPQLSGSDVVSMHPPSHAAVPLAHPASTAPSVASYASAVPSSEASATDAGASGAAGVSSAESGSIDPS
jgi:hypothetical protein